MTITALPEMPLDQLQRPATNAAEGPIIIIGGPGTGKTHTIMGRIAALRAAGAPANHIAYLTFTSNGAQDVRRQMDHLDGIRDVFTGTFHQYASFFLRQAGANVLGISPYYTIWNWEQAAETIADLAELDPDNLDINITPSGLRDLTRWHQLNQARPSDEPLPARESSWHRLMELYTAEKRLQNTLDFDDLVPFAVRALQASPIVRANWSRTRSRHLLVDEFQDITPSQYRMLQLMTGPTNSIAIATDPNQNIYTWRGSDASLLQQFQLDHQDAQTHLLRVNHRSTGSLSRASTQVTNHPSMTGLHDALQTAIRPEGPHPVFLNCLGTPSNMDHYIIDTMYQLRSEGYEWEDMAVIYRLNNTGDRMISQLITRSIPHSVLGDTRQTAHDDSRCITNMLTVLLNPNDSNAFSIAAAIDPKLRRRRFNRHITRQLLKTSLAQNTNLIDTTDQYLASGHHNPSIARHLRYVTTAWRELSPMLDDPEVSLYNLCRRAHSLLHDARGGVGIPFPGPDLARLFTLSEITPRLPEETPRQHLSRFIELLSTAPYPDHRSLDNDDPYAHHSGVTLTTIHAAKGLQWKAVWVNDASDHVIPGPLSQGPHAQSNLHEEQRIFYVAATRATDRLYICSSVNYDGLQAEPSRFVNALTDLTRAEFL